MVATALSPGLPGGVQMRFGPAPGSPGTRVVYTPMMKRRYAACLAAMVKNDETTEPSHFGAAAMNALRLTVKSFGLSTFFFSASIIPS